MREDITTDSKATRRKIRDMTNNFLPLNLTYMSQTNTLNDTNPQSPLFKENLIISNSILKTEFRVKTLATVTTRKQILASAMLLASTAKHFRGK